MRPNGQQVPGSGDGGDPLDGMPPIGPLRTAKATNGLSMPHPSPAILAMTGAGPAASLIDKMVALERMVEDVSKDLPELRNTFAPAIQQMRDLGAARLADQASGGMGATNPDATAPPPGMAAGGPMSGAGAGAGGPIGMPPPPMV